MKEHLIQIIQENRDPLQALNHAREYLQARLLLLLQRAGGMVPLAFQGGTALRFLYGLRRFSEDLDFSLEKKGKGYDLKEYLRIIQRDLTYEGYSTDIKLNNQKAVHSAMVRFKGLPYELGLSMLPDENLSIKIEVDSNPPRGAKLETTLIRRFELLQLQHHDKASLLAGKLHAFLQRGHTKGRDLYDLMWYFSDKSWPDPNLSLLRNALHQTGYQAAMPDEKNWKEMVRIKMDAIDWAAAVRDVQPFLEDARERELLTKKNLVDLLDKK